VKVVDSMMRCLTEREQERVWELRAEGHSSRAIGRELGLRPQYVSLCVALTGGVGPAVRKRSRRCLTESEREEISRGLARGDGFRAIAVRIARSHTAVSREVNRNGGRARYRAQHAEAAAWDRARRPKPSKLALNSTLRALVEEQLELRWSPQQISRWLRRIYGDDEAMGVSHRRSICRSLSSRAVPCAAS
jgi:IS30 family transposase